MEAESLEGLFKRLNDSPDDVALLREIFRVLRMTSTRYSEFVVKNGQTIINSLSGGWFGPSEELWSVIEQVFLAALDTNQIEVASKQLSLMRKQFPTSSKVDRLTGMLKEAEGNYDAAEDTYNLILARDESDSLTRKRLICLLKAQKKKRPQAIEKMNDYLKDFQADVTAWKELGDMYLDEQQYRFAGFCYEELIAAEPLNFHYTLRYAEIMFTLGEFNIARKYFAYTLELNPPNVRAMYGMALASKALNAQKGVTANDKKENDDILNFSITQIKSRYNNTPFKQTSDAVITQLES
eukprot:TRINITY_DN6059_c0_g2_i1.p1 TRINITY_DN6059_c0_g2~~TRINITY_DN6059_c0_g2_i1.p1  ORF type:complete len:296 (-),score=70.41 TRINITY_DN6059_c0_g2_i1:41-928(-)